ncbi:hypothetical protein AB0G67_08220 [Streptomyces sp. NPDC021056]|uniref:hypothetical protein n=1 Tax=Streptomyces sp. NPDC021056 TaxID=3155012 RepID=UPI0033EC0A6D
MDELTFDDVLDYFVEHRPDDPAVHHGALLARRDPAFGVTCVQLFVDRRHRPCVSPTGHPYGRSVLAKRLSLELRQQLGGRELIIFE